MLQLHTVLDGGSDSLLFIRWRAPERMMAMIVISDSDVQEATRRSLMTVAPSPVREVVCNVFCSLFICNFLGSNTAALTQDTDTCMLASFSGSFPLLAVRVGPYCKQQEAGRWLWNKAIDVHLSTLVSHAHYLCVAVSSMQQLCRTLVFSYFQCLLPAHSSPVRVLTRAACSVDGWIPDKAMYVACP